MSTVIKNIPATRVDEELARRGLDPDRKVTVVEESLSDLARQSQEPYLSYRRNRTYEVASLAAGKSALASIFNADRPTPPPPQPVEQISPFCRTGSGLFDKTDKLV